MTLGTSITTEKIKRNNLKLPVVQNQQYSTTVRKTTKQQKIRFSGKKNSDHSYCEVRVA